MASKMRFERIAAARKDRPTIPHARTLNDMALTLSLLELFQRDTCPQKVECIPCPSGQSCSIVAKSATQCSKAICVLDDSDGSSSKGPGAGAIAGGVIGGIVAIAVLTYLVWKFLIKPKRASDTATTLHSSVFEPDNSTIGREEKPESLPLQRRNSATTVHSIASTVLTRASNIIQIAYIPGVTNRPNTGQGSNNADVLVPPVPPMPGNHSSEYPYYSSASEARNSTYSGFSGYSEAPSHSVAGNRSSIASTIYGRQAQVQNPAQAGVRAKPTVVSVKGSGNTPPMNQHVERFADRPESTLSSVSLTSTMLNSANTAMPGRAQVVKVGIKKNSPSQGSDAASSTASIAISSVDSEKEVVTPEILQTMTLPAIAYTPPTDPSPFADPPSNVAQRPSLADIKEESSSSLPKNTKSPFSDEHATK